MISRLGRQTSHRESNLSMSACEYDAPTTIPPLLEALLRGICDLLRQNGEEDRLQSLAMRLDLQLIQHTYSDLSAIPSH